MIREDIKGKVLAYTSAIMSDVKSDFSMARSVKVAKTPISTRKNIVKKAIKSDPKKLTKLLKEDGGKSLAEAIRDGNKAQSAVLEELNSMKKLLAVSASTNLESLDRANFRDKIANKKEQRDDNKRVDKLISILEADSKNLDEDLEHDEVAQILNKTTNNYYGSDVDSPMGGDGGDRPCPKGKKGRKCRARKKAKAKRNKNKAKTVTKSKMPRVGGMVKGAGALGAVMVASDYVLGDRELNPKNLSEDGSMVAGSMAGATLGAVVGSVIPVVGTAIGGLLGGIIGGIGGSKLGKELYSYFSKDKKETLEEVTKKIINKAGGKSIVSYNINSSGTPTNNYGAVAIDSHGKPIKNKSYNTVKKSENFNSLDSDSYKYLNLDDIEGTKYTADDGRGREAFGGIDKIHQPEMFARVSRGEISPHDANKEMLAKLTKQLHKRMPGLKDRSQLAQEFAGILAMNTGAGSLHGGEGGKPNGAVAFKPTYDLIDQGKYDEAMQHIAKTNLTPNHKKHLISALVKARSEGGLVSEAKEVEKVKKANKLALPDLVAKEAINSSSPQLDNIAEKLDRVATKLDETLNNESKKSKSPTKPTSTIKSGESKLPDHIEPMNDYTLIALANEE